MAGFALKALLFSAGSATYALINILAQYSKSADGSYAYSPPAVILVAEFVKLCLSMTFLTQETGSVKGALRLLFSGSSLAWAGFGIPSVLFAINNNLDMFNNQHMDPATEQVLLQGKIITTGIVWWLVFQKPLLIRQWLSLFVLFAGTVLAGWPTSSDGKVKEMFIDSIGVMAVCLYVCISACCAVYTEWLYKTELLKNDSIHVSNIRLYIFGCLFNLSAHSSGFPSVAAASRVFDGFNAYVYGMVATYACMGLLISIILKRFGNIAKLFMSGSSMYISGVASYVCFGFLPTTQFLVGLFLVTVAMVMYNAEKIFPGLCSNVVDGKKVD